MIKITLNTFMSILVLTMMTPISNAQNLDHLTLQKEQAPFGNLQKTSYVGNIVYTSQPDANTISMLKEKGFDMVISVKYEDEKLDFDERKIVEKNGMSFVKIPYFKGSIKDKIRNVDDAGVAELSKTIAMATKSGRKILLHCASGQRAAAVLGSILARDYGYSKADAQSASTTAGLTSKNTGAAFERYFDGLK